MRNGNQLLSMRDSPRADDNNAAQAALAHTESSGRSGLRVSQSPLVLGSDSVGTMVAMATVETTPSVVSLTPAAAAKITELLAAEQDVSVLRVAIEGGGCSG